MDTVTDTHFISDVLMANHLPFASREVSFNDRLRNDPLKLELQFFGLLNRQSNLTVVQWYINVMGHIWYSITEDNGTQ